MSSWSSASSSGSSSGSGSPSGTSCSSATSSASGSSSSSSSSSVSAGALAQEQINHFREIFNLFDQAGTGSIAVADLQSVMQRVGSAASASDMHQLVEMADADNDGVITFAEFCKMMGNLHKIQLRELYQAFKVFDSDGNGFIDAAELSQVFTAMGKPRSDRQLNKMIGEADVNNDGGISFPEFAVIMGYRGNVTDISVEDLSLGTMSSVSSASSSASSSSSGSGSDVVVKGKMKVTVEAFHMDRQWTIKTKGTARLKDFAKAVSKKSGIPADHMRLYVRGFVMSDPNQTLADYYVNGTKTVFIVVTKGIGDMESSECFAKGKYPALGAIYEHFLREGTLENNDAIKIIKKATKIMKSEPNMVEVEDPVTVVGDIHGQFYDLKALLTAGGEFSTDHTYVFLGDYVDRGYFSSEVMIFLLAVKVMYPRNVYLLRGNHESAKMTKKYGTQAEVIHKYNKKVMKALIKCFNTMPLYALIGSGGHRFLGMHGGLSPKISKLSQIEDINRMQEPPSSGPLKDCLWSDPHKECVNKKRNLPTSWDLTSLDSHSVDAPRKFKKEFFEPSKQRGGSVSDFMPDALNFFLNKNGLLAIFRAHEQKQRGYEMYKFGPEYEFPACITVFSAPNYTDKSMNEGCVVVMEGGTLEFRTYGWRMHPIYHSFMEHDRAFERDIEKEDLVQMVNFLHKNALQELPIGRLENAYHDMFVEKSREGAAGSEASASGDDIDNWRWLNANLMEVLKLSSNPEVRRLYKKKSRSMLAWFEGFDHFQNAVESESDFEVDFQESYPHIIEYFGAEEKIVVHLMKEDGSDMEHKWERAMESGFSVINPIYIKGRAYLMQYKQTDGSFMLFEIRADGRGLTELWRDRRSPGYTIIKSFYLKDHTGVHHPYTFSYAGGVGEQAKVTVDRVKDDATGVDVVWRGEWRSDYDIIEPFYVGDEQACYLCIYRKIDGYFVFARCKDNPEEGVEVVWARVLSPGWDLIQPFYHANGRRPYVIMYNYTTGVVEIDRIMRDVLPDGTPDAKVYLHQEWRDNWLPQTWTSLTDFYLSGFPALLIYSAETQRMVFVRTRDDGIGVVPMRESPWNSDSTMFIPFYLDHHPFIQTGEGGGA